MPILGGCLCFDLPTGSKIIGAIYLLSAVLNTLMLVVINLMVWVMDFMTQLLEMFESMLDNQQQQHHHHLELVKDDDDYIDTNGNSTSAAANEHLREILRLIRDHVFAFKVLCLVLLVLAFLSVISSSLLIHGIRKNRRGMLVPWILQEVVHILVALTLVVVFFVLFGSSSISWAFALPMILCMFIQVFFIVVVISQFQALGLIRMHDEMCMK